jgi:hypothetical protein
LEEGRGLKDKAMSATIRVRKVHIDYAGADGLPKPMILAITVGPGFTKIDYETRVRRIFEELFPEWKLRTCEVGDEDLDVEEGKLRAVSDVPGIWGAAG